MWCLCYFLTTLFKCPDQSNFDETEGYIPSWWGRHGSWQGMVSGIRGWLEYLLNPQSGSREWAGSRAELCILKLVPVLFLPQLTQGFRAFRKQHHQLWTEYLTCEHIGAVSFQLQEVAKLFHKDSLLLTNTSLTASPNDLAAFSSSWGGGIRDFSSPVTRFFSKHNTNGNKRRNIQIYLTQVLRDKIAFTSKDPKKQEKPCFYVQVWWSSRIVGWRGWSNVGKLEGLDKVCWPTLPCVPLLADAGKFLWTPLTWRWCDMHQRKLRAF